MTKRSNEVSVVGLNLQTFRTLSQEDRAKAVKDWFKQAFDQTLDANQLDVPPSERMIPPAK